MMERVLRLGDSIDDHCSRCRRITGHSVVTLREGDPGTVRCQACDGEHPYRQSRAGRRKKSEVKSLVDKMLEGMPAPRGLAPPKPTRTPGRLVDPDSRENSEKTDKGH